jgi:hypothetical protein
MFSENSGGSYLKASGMLFGGAVAGGALGVLATKWANKDKINQAVAEAQQSASHAAQQEVQQVKQELGKVSAAADKLKVGHQKEISKLTDAHAKQVEELGKAHQAEIGELKQEIGRKEGEVSSAKAAVTKETTNLKKAHKTEISAMKSEHEKAIKDLGAKHQGEVEELKAKHQSEIEGLGAEHAGKEEDHGKAIEALKKSHEEAIQGLDQGHADKLKEAEARHTEELTGLHQKLGEKEAELKAATDKVEELKSSHQGELDRVTGEHQKAIASINSAHEGGIAKLQKSFEDHKEQAIQSGTIGRKSELEQEYRDKGRTLENSMATELAKRTEEAENKANSAAAAKLVEEREKVMAEAQLKIREATEPKARKPGQLIDDDKQGIVLRPSIRQGYDITNKSVENTRRNFSEATKRLIGRQADQALQGLSVEFKNHVSAIHNDPDKKWNSKWDGIKTALTQQGQREAVLLNGLDEIRNSTLGKYNKAFEDFDGSDESAQAFDKKSQSIHKGMLKDVGDLIDSVKQRNPLDQPFTGQRRKEDSVSKIYTVVGAL